MKNLKSISTCCLTLGTALFFSFSAMAATTVITAPGGNISSTVTGEPALNVKLSPGVELGHNPAATGASFAIDTWNRNVDSTSGNRNEYGIASDYAGYYMLPIANTVANTTALTAPTAANSTAFPVTTWVKQ